MSENTNKQLLEALKELVIDMKIAQGNMRAAAVRDPKWEGCAEAIQPRVDMAESAIVAAEQEDPAIPKGAFAFSGQLYEIGSKWIHYAQSMGGDSNDIAVAIWSAIREALDVKYPEQAQRPCPYCDGTGDVHSITGEWRGVCSCEAGKAQAEAAQQLNTQRTENKHSILFPRNRYV